MTHQELYDKSKRMRSLQRMKRNELNPAESVELGIIEREIDEEIKRVEGVKAKIHYEPKNTKEEKFYNRIRYLRRNQLDYRSSRDHSVYVKLVLLEQAVDRIFANDEKASEAERLQLNLFHHI